VGVGGSEKGSFPDREQKDVEKEKEKKVQVFPFVSYSDESTFWGYWI